MKATGIALPAFLLAATLLPTPLLPTPVSSPLSAAIWSGNEAPAEMQLRSFAKAYVKVEKIREAYEPQLSATPDAERLVKLNKKQYPRSAR